jgi:uncharacterized protein YecT (DUF1311 family)
MESASFNYITVAPKFLLLAGLLPMVAAAQAPAKRNPIDIAYDKCTENRANQSTAGLSECSTTAYNAWDKELNIVYRKLMAVLDADAKQNLKTAQVDWLKFRDSQTKLYSGIHAQLQGTMYIPIFADRTVNLVRQRVIELQGLLELVSG